MTAVRIVLGIGLVLGSLPAIFSFEKMSGWFLFLSQDGSVVPHSMLQLRICLISLGIIGLYLVFSNSAKTCLAFVDRIIMSLCRSDFLTIFFITALLLRVAVILLFPFRLWIDYMVYDELGWHWVEAGGYYVGSYPTAYRPPGYPFFLSRLYWIFGHHPQLGVIANVIFSMAIIWLSYLLARKIWNERVARWTLVFLTFFPSQILFVNLLASEPLFTTLFLISIYLLISVEKPGYWKWHYALLGGVVLGLATLTRALTQVYLILPAIYWYLQTGRFSRTIRNTMIAAVGFIIVITPWLVRNYHHKGKLTISTNTGINLLIGNQPGSGMGWNQPVTDEFDFDDPTMETYIDSVGWHRGWQYIKSDPVAFVKRGILKVLYFYAVDMESVGYELVEAANSNRTGRYVVIAFITQTYYVTVLFFGFLGLLTRYFTDPRWRRPGGFLLWMTIAFWTAVHFVFFADGRFHFPIVPIISTFAAIYTHRNVGENGS
jgi:4-amino-4-deoxy-L-arabinose transferase-like glycosyltransferase